MDKKAVKEEKEVITFRGNRTLWLDFVYGLKKERKQVWEVLEEFIAAYLKKR